MRHLIKKSYCYAVHTLTNKIEYFSIYSAFWANIVYVDTETAMLFAIKILTINEEQINAPVVSISMNFV
jgi:hypothetical protein